MTRGRGSLAAFYGDRLLITSWGAQPMLIKQLLEEPLALNLWHRAQIVAVEVQQVEGVVRERPACSPRAPPEALKSWCGRP